MSYITDSFDDEIVRLINGGGVGVLPTDTIYGLSCRALDEQAVERLYQVKVRDKNKPFIVLISDIKMLDLLSIPRDWAKLVEAYWPGPLSAKFIVPNSQVWLERGTGTIAVRLPDHPDLTGLIQKTGPIISTSANLEGQTPAKSVVEAKRIFGKQLDFYIDVGPLENESSTLVSVENNHLKVIRQGAVKIK